MKAAGLEAEEKGVAGDAPGAEPLDRTRVSAHIVSL